MASDDDGIKVRYCETSSTPSMRLCENIQRVKHFKSVGVHEKVKQFVAEDTSKRE